MQIQTLAISFGMALAGALVARIVLPPTFRLLGRFFHHCADRLS